MHLYNIPGLYCPFPIAIHDSVNDIEIHTNEWLQEFQLLNSFDLINHYRQQKFASFIARSFPLGEYMDLCVWCDFNTLLFIIDDQLDADTNIKDKDDFFEFQKKFTDVLYSNFPLSIESSGPILSALSDIWRKLSLRSSSSWRNRFRKDIADMFSGGYWQFDLVSKGKKPNLSEYIMKRQYLGAAHLSTGSLEITGKINLDELIYNDTSIIKLTELCRNAVCFSNDLFSFGKEIEESQNGAEFNLVTILKRKFNISIEQAIDKAAKMHDNIVYDFIDLSEKIYNYDVITNSNLKRYVNALEYIMSGNIYWSVFETSRYPHVSEMKSTKEDRPKYELGY